jgi:hypothetical protein
MRNPFQTLSRWITSSVVSLILIITILLGYNLLRDEFAKLETLEIEQANLHKFKKQLKDHRDKYAKELLTYIPPPGALPTRFAEQIKLLKSEINTKQTSRQRLWDDHPVERHLPTSGSFRQIATLDIEISYLQQVLNYTSSLYTIIAGPIEAKRQIDALQASSNNLATQIYQNRKEQWELSQRAPVLWQIPFTDASRRMKRFEEGARLLQIKKDKDDAEIVRQQGVLQLLQKRTPPSPLTIDHGQANRISQSLDDRLEANDKQLQGSSLQKYLRPVKAVLPNALLILLLALFSPFLVKAITYYLIAPIAQRRAPLQLLPDSSGIISTSTGSIGNQFGSAAPSRVSLSLAIDEQSELLVLPSYLQGMPLSAKSDTKWLLDWSMPLTSFIAGMYRLTRIRPNTEEHITVSSSTDPLTEFSLLEIPVGSALVLQPRCLVGIIQTLDDKLNITRHWIFNSLGAWLTLQFRYIVFHGPAKLIVKGCRGVRIEPAITGRTVNQAATLGFSANLNYSVARNETFWSYYFGERELFNDSWQGDGCCIHAETPHPGDHSGFFGRGLQGIVDSFLKIFGI